MLATQLNNNPILLVEDNPDDAELTTRALKSKKLSNDIVWVKDGQEALDYLFSAGKYADRGKELPALVLLDLQLPKIGGLDVLKKIRAEPGTQRLPVVILTSSREESDLVRGYNVGCNSYVCKPVEFEEFINAVQQLSLYWLVLNETPPR